MSDHKKVSGFSGNEIFCLHKLGHKPGQLCIGNNVLSLGVVRGIGAGLSNLAGGEITEITKIVHEGRKNAYRRMLDEAKNFGGIGIADVTFDIINHGSNLEFLAMGSTIQDSDPTSTQKLSFSSYSNAQQLYCQMDAGFSPNSFVFSNVAYSIGVGKNITGALSRMKRGEVSQYTEIFDRTRHLALTRLQAEAKRYKANAVLGIETTITSLMGAQEMLMTGTAATHPLLAEYAENPVTCDMTNEELWNMVHIGFLPVGLVMGVSVYSLGVASSLMAFGKSLKGGEVNTLTELLYEAREKAFDRIEADADRLKADEVVGVKTYVYDLGNGLIEILAIGTAVKKIEGAQTKSENLIPQAIIQDKETFVEASGQNDKKVSLGGKDSARKVQMGPIQFIFTAILVIFYVIVKLAAH